MNDRKGAVRGGKVEVEGEPKDWRLGRKVATDSELGVAEGVIGKETEWESV